MSELNNIKTVVNETFGENVKLLPSVTELFEFELAYLEFQSLSQDVLLERTAFLKSFKNKLSKHYLLYSETPEVLSENRSALTQSYFKNRQFSTGYATHGLFPYRGKFHPQLIKGLINIIGIKQDETVLDPMAGSGTTNVEAALMGINSIAMDVSPFCQFMIKTKYDALSIDIKLLEKLNIQAKEFFSFFNPTGVLKKINEFEENKRKIYQLAFLAYLDALGYSKRVVKSTHNQLFEKVLPRYIETVKTFLKNPNYNQKQLGTLKVLHNSDALQMRIDSNSIDAVITSPPYSFAIDYIENDREQLEFLGYDTIELKSRLVGLKGKTIKEKLETYFQDG